MLVKKKNFVQNIFRNLVKKCCSKTAFGLKKFCKKKIWSVIFWWLLSQIWFHPPWGIGLTVLFGWGRWRGGAVGLKSLALFARNFFICNSFLLLYRFRFLPPWGNRLCVLLGLEMDGDQIFIIVDNIIIIAVLFT